MHKRAKNKVEGIVNTRNRLIACVCKTRSPFRTLKPAAAAPHNRYTTLCYELNGNGKHSCWKKSIFYGTTTAATL